jgi:thymidylate kinase
VTNSDSPVHWLVPLVARQAAVLHGGESGRAWDSNRGGDLDVVTRELDPWWPLRLPPGAHLCQRIRYDVTGSYWLVSQGLTILALDTLDDPQGIGQYGIPTADALAGSDGLASSGFRAAYLALKRIRKGMASEEAWQRIGELGRSDPAGLQGALTSSIGSNLAQHLAEEVLAGRVPDARIWGRVQWVQAARRFANPARGLKLTCLIAVRWFQRLAHPTGLWVIVAGPDGTGKSSLAQALPEACRGLFRRDVHMHWRPGLLPQPGSLLRISGGDPTTPHALRPHPILISLARLFYFWVDFGLGSLVKVLPMRIRTGMVVMERGWADMAVDPLRYRLRVPGGLVRALSWVLPRPDLLLVLDAPAEVVTSRKSELSPGEIERQRGEWRSLRLRGVERVLLDASRGAEQVLDEARSAIVRHLEQRALRNLRGGWVQLPPASSRFLIPRGPRKVARTALAVYQPVTPWGRLGWEAARIIASVGGFRLARRSDAPPEEVRQLLAAHLPRRSTFAVMRANHPGRVVALVVDEGGEPRMVAKLATTSDGSAALAREAEAITEFGPALRGALRPPRLLAVEPGILLLEAIRWRPHVRTWRLTEDSAAALGRFSRAGFVHGDCAPWNLLRTADGGVLCDWESARNDQVPFQDIFHFLVQSCALLGRPSTRSVRTGLYGRGWVGSVINAYSEAAGLASDSSTDALVNYLRESLDACDVNTREGRRGIRVRRELLAALERERL